MRRLLAIVLALVLLGAAALVALAWPRDEFIAARSPLDYAPTLENIGRGAYLARAGDCMACHTARGGVPYAGNRALDTPFGQLVTPNITPDAGTGIGTWSADDFWQALHNGKSQDGRLLYPAFPYTHYTRVTRPDADALFAYLRQLPPVRQANRGHALRFPYNQQLTLAAWRLLYFKPGVQQPDTTRDARWNRGAYLTEGLGHCAACHSARNSLGAIDGKLNGAIMPGSGWYAPALDGTPRSGLGNWSEAHLVQLLGTGVAPNASVAGPMAEVVAQSLQYLNQDDLGAMAAYLKALPAAPARPALDFVQPPDALMQAGARLYGQHCASCHGDQGAGQGPYPALAGNGALRLANPVNALRAVLHGGFAPGTEGNPRPYGMPPFGHVMNDTELATLLTWLRASWGNEAPGVSAAEVNRQRNVPLD